MRAEAALRRVHLAESHAPLNNSLTKLTSALHSPSPFQHHPPYPFLPSYPQFAGWEREFLRRILLARRGEDDYVLRELLLFAWQISCTIVLPQLAAAITFIAYAAPTNRALSAKDAFAALTLFNTLRFPLMGLGEAVSAAVQVLVSIDRLQEILSIPEVVRGNPAEAASEGRFSRDGEEEMRESGGVGWKAPRPGAGGGRGGGGDGNGDGDGGARQPALEIVDGAFWWPSPPPAEKDASPTGKAKKSKPRPLAAAAGPPTNRKVPPTELGGGASAGPSAASDADGEGAIKRGFVLSGLNLSVSRGEILAVIGPVGSGKSTLISGILADACRSGRLSVSAPKEAPSGDVPVSPSALDLDALSSSKVNSGEDVATADIRSLPMGMRMLGRVPSVPNLHNADGLWCGGVAYCGQNAWLLSGTVRDNILFGARRAPLTFPALSLRHRVPSPSASPLQRPEPHRPLCVFHVRRAAVGRGALPSRHQRLLPVAGHRCAAGPGPDGHRCARPVPSDGTGRRAAVACRDWRALVLCRVH